MVTWEGRPVPAGGAIVSMAQAQAILQNNPVSSPPPRHPPDSGKLLTVKSGYQAQNLPGAMHAPAIGGNKIGKQDRFAAPTVARQNGDSNSYVIASPYKPKVPGTAEETKGVQQYIRSKFDAF